MDLELFQKRLRGGPCVGWGKGRRRDEINPESGGSEGLGRVAWAAVKRRIPDHSGDQGNRSHVMREMEIMAMDKAVTHGYQSYSYLYCQNLCMTKILFRYLRHLLLIGVTKILVKLARKPFYYPVGRFLLDRYLGKYLMVSCLNC